MKTEIMREASTSCLDFWSNLALRTNPYESMQIIQAHIITEGYQVVLFQKDDGSWRPVSGQVQTEESFVSAASREIQEKVGLSILPDQIIVSDHSSSCVSRRRKKGFRGNLFYSFAEFYQPGFPFQRRAD